MREFLVGANSYANLDDMRMVPFHLLFGIVCFSRLTLYIIHIFAKKSIIMFMLLYNILFRALLMLAGSYLLFA